MISILKMTSLKARLILGLLVMGFVVLAFDTASFAQSNRELRGRIDRMEKEIETLSRALFRGEQPENPSSFTPAANPQATAALEVRLSQLETELRNIRGTLEEQSFEMRQLKQELERFRGDVELRVEDLEKQSSANVPSQMGGAKYINRSGANLTGSNLQPAIGAVGDEGYSWNSNGTGNSTSDNSLGTLRQDESGAVITGHSDLAAATYENAFSLLKRERYEAAAKEFQSFLSNHSGHALAGNAQYWLGETYYVRGQFEQAARSFAEGYKKYPQNTKAADNLLKLGMSLAQLDKKDDACVALSQLEKDDFKGSQQVLRRAAQEKTRLSC